MSLDFYGEDFSYIHAKFGDLRKMFFFTEEFEKAHPKFCAEYRKYWENDKTGKFQDPLQIVNYVEHWNIPVKFYFNYTDTPAKNNRDVKEYLLRERMPSSYMEHIDGKWCGWDGEPEVEKTEDRNVEMDVMAPLAEEITLWVVENLTTLPMLNPDNKEELHDEVQPIYNNVLDILDKELNQ